MVILISCYYKFTQIYDICKYLAGKYIGKECDNSKKS